MQDRAAREVPTDLDDRDPPQDLEPAGPRTNRWIRSRDPLQVWLCDQHGYVAQHPAPFHLDAEHVRVTRHDCDDLTQLAHASRDVAVDVAGGIPQQIARRCSDEVGLPADADLRFDGNAE